MADKWGIPYFYPTAPDAGVSGEGSGFNWQQSNNIRDDQDKGMVRLGKESDDVEVISTTTGEFEFPFDAGADYFCHEGRQGHKSGGEEHGCEGSCYIMNVTINETPPRFYFQKQMYHGGPKFQHSSGKFTHSRATEKVIGNGWKGLATVIYSKKNGRSTGQNSAFLEIWWNEDPVNKLKDGWFMVKRIEDKGGWGTDGDSCNGMDDQVITWSNIQFRYKSGTPDFSLHPRKPEYEDGPVIHSIGEEDMDFAACNKRGYGYREDMPRDYEMKCLFKFDSDDGKCRLKNLSLREIDSLKALDSDPNEPDTNEQPGTTTTIQGKLKLMWDLNIMRASACAGAGAGGAGGTVIFHDNQNQEEYRALANHATHNNRTRVGQKITTSAPPAGRLIKQFDTLLKRVGTPTGNVSAKIWNLGTGATLYTSPTTFASGSLGTTNGLFQFDFSTNTHTLVDGDIVGVEYTGTSDVNYVDVSIQMLNSEGGYRVQYENGVWLTFSSTEFCCRMWT